MPFYGRRRELKMLDDIFARPHGKLFVLYGRRRVGKTALIQHWLSTRKPRGFYWAAHQSSSPILLRALSHEIQRVRFPGQAVPAEFTFSSWDMAFREIASLAQNAPLVVVLDEFTYLLESDRSVASLLQNTWDGVLKDTNIFLILSGSHAGMIARDVLAYRSPLFGRAAQTLHLQPLPFGVVTEMFPKMPGADLVTLYGLVGGIVDYLAPLRENASLSDNLRALLIDSKIMEDAPSLLRDQLGNAPNYLAIVEMIAAGYNRVTDIARMVDQEPTSVSYYLKTLQDLGVVERLVPALEPHPERSKQGRYVIRDHYLRFFYRFVSAEVQRLRQGLDRQAMGKLTQHIAEFTGTFAFEELCREWVERTADAGQLPFLPRRVGAVWGRGRPQIDVLAINPDEHAILLGECKWTGGAVDMGVAEKLLKDAPDIVPAPAEQWKVYLAFFSKNGFTPDARRAASGANCLWVDLDKLIRDLRALTN